MDLSKKLSILASAAKYDASCASSGSSRGGKGALGRTLPSGVCHSWTGDGRCVSLLKLLFSNACHYDCAYCVNRRSADIERAAFTVRELVDLTVAFYKRNFIEGLFLSSGVFADPDQVMAKLIETARTLRKEAGFNGYIHLKLIPGVSPSQIAEAGRWADRLSANIELPTESSLRRLAPGKEGRIIMGSMATVKDLALERTEDRRRRYHAPTFAPAGQSTQLVVGASPEDDRQILNLSVGLYRKFGLKRVYYSAFVPPGATGGAPDTRLPPLAAPPLLREHRLYQADWLLRFYRFSPDEVTGLAAPFLASDIDPKSAWALAHIDRFPIELRTADLETILRVPGIGAINARRIVETRKTRCLSEELLRSMGVSLKRARWFITIGGVSLERRDDPSIIRRSLASSARVKLASSGQLDLFS